MGSIRDWLRKRKEDKEVKREVDEEKTLGEIKHVIGNQDTVSVVSASKDLGDTVKDAQMSFSSDASSILDSVDSFTQKMSNKEEKIEDASNKLLEESARQIDQLEEDMEERDKELKYDEEKVDQTVESTEETLDDLYDFLEEEAINMGYNLKNVGMTVENLSFEVEKQIGDGKGPSDRQGIKNDIGSSKSVIKSNRERINERLSSDREMIDENLEEIKEETSLEEQIEELEAREELYDNIKETVEKSKEEIRERSSVDISMEGYSEETWEKFGELAESVAEDGEIDYNVEMEVYEDEDRIEINLADLERYSIETEVGDEEVVVDGPEEALNMWQAVALSYVSEQNERLNGVKEKIDTVRESLEEEITRYDGIIEEVENLEAVDPLAESDEAVETLKEDDYTLADLMTIRPRDLRESYKEQETIRENAEEIVDQAVEKLEEVSKQKELREVTDYMEDVQKESGISDVGVYQVVSAYHSAKAISNELGGIEAKLPEIETRDEWVEKEKEEVYGNMEKEIPKSLRI